jgi:hypothetical protein
MSNQLVMYEEELAQISNICDVLQRDFAEITDDDIDNLFND